MAKILTAASLATVLWASSLTAQPVASFTPMPRQWPISSAELSMVYDSVNQRVIAFGGYEHNWIRTNEIWEYTPATQRWRSIAPVPGPKPVRRSAAAMAYDPTRQRVILFGGRGNTGEYLGDTWEWDVNAHTWTQVATGGTPGTNKPVPREGCQAVYDPSRDRVVLYGGGDLNFFYGDTWLFDLGAHTWSQLTTTRSSPYASTSGAAQRWMLPRKFHTLTITNTNRLFAFGGVGFQLTSGGVATGGVISGEDLWELVGTVWTDRTPSGPKAANDSACSNAAACPGTAGWRAFTADTAGNRLVTQGGYDVPSYLNIYKAQAFSLATNTWSQISPNIAGVDAISKRDSHAMVYDPVGARVILYGGYLADLWMLSGSTWTSPPAFDPRTSYLVYTYPREDYHAMAYDSLRGRLLAVVGGAPETWRLDPSTWYWTIASVTGVSDRVGHAVAYSPVIDRMLMFGGRCKWLGYFALTGGPCGAGGTLYNDLRAFNPATNTWTTLTPSGGPPAARWDHGFVYDAARNNFVLFGGRTAIDQPYSDTWILSCSGPTTCSWTPGPAGPPGNFGLAMADDPVRDRVVMFGGDSGAGAYSNVWEWNGSAWSNVTPGGTTPGVTAPTGRAHPGLVPFSTTLPGLLMFGGNDGAPRNDAWIWTGTQWRPAALGGGVAIPPRENPEMVYAPNANRIFTLGGFDADGPLSGDAALITTFVKGDVDTSDTTDLILQSPSTANPILWTMNGVTRLAELTASAGLAAGQKVVGVDDFNYDGKNDLVVWNSSTGAVTFWFMNGTTVTSTTALTGGPLPVEWKLVATNDFNHDGKPDLVWRNSTTQKLAIWYLNGTTLAGAAVPTPDQAVDANWEVVGALDYNADGNTDLLWYNPTSGKIVFWFLDYNAVRTVGQFANPENAGNNNWRVVAAGDYGTTAGGPLGTKDIVWRNATSGRFVVWYMDTAGNRLPSGGLFTNPLEPSPNPTLWTIVGPK